MSDQKSPVVVGDFFEESWGYDQTNVDFYEVVKVSASGQTIWMRHVSAAVVRNGPAEYLAPIPGAFDRSDTNSPRDGLLRKRVRSYSDRPVVTMTTYSNAYLWDCKPAYQTASGWGH